MLKDKKGQIYNYFNAFMLARFTLFIFLIVILYLFITPVFYVARETQKSMDCASTFTFMCFIAYATLPVLFIIVMALSLKYLVGEPRK